VEVPYLAPSLVYWSAAIACVSSSSRGEVRNWLKVVIFALLIVIVTVVVIVISDYIMQLDQDLNPTVHSQPLRPLHTILSHQDYYGHLYSAKSPKGH